MIRSDDDEKNGSRDHDRGGWSSTSADVFYVLLNSDVGYIDTIPPTSDGCHGHASSLVLFVIWIDEEEKNKKKSWSRCSSSSRITR